MQELLLQLVYISGFVHELQLRKDTVARFFHLLDNTADNFRLFTHEIFDFTWARERVSTKNMKVNIPTLAVEIANIHPGQ